MHIIVLLQLVLNGNGDDCIVRFFIKPRYVPTCAKVNIDFSVVDFVWHGSESIRLQFDRLDCFSDGCNGSVCRVWVFRLLKCMKPCKV